MPHAYYNEIEPFAAQWLRNLIAAGHLPGGEVDERSICDVQPADLAGFDQCHFFAGLGGWAHVLRMAGWPDGRVAWTGSCPCQPFSSAGKGGGFADERHLWPEFFRLIRECRPGVVFGEQVASPAGLAWLDAVQADLEAKDYAVGAFDLCAAGVGAPHIRQRLYWAADAGGNECKAWRDDRASGWQAQEPAGLLPAGHMADANEENWERGVGRGRREGASEETLRRVPVADGPGALGLLGNARVDGARQHPRELPGHEGEHEVGPALGHHAPEHPSAPGPTNGFWRDVTWLPCRDGKLRPTQPGLFPLAHGTPGRVGRLRAYGNAIVAPLATEFVKAYLSI